MNALLVFLILIICVGAVSASEDVSTDDTVNGINTEPAVIDQGSTFNEIDNNNDNNLKEANEDSNIVSSGNGYIGDSSDDSENHIIDISENSKSSMNKLSSSKLGEGNVIYLKPNAKNGDGSQSKPFGSFKEALELAVDGDTIIVNASAAATLKGENNTGLTISQNDLTIKAVGAKKVTVNAEKKNQIFEITGNNVMLQGLTFSNGNSTNGGAISVKGNDVKIDSCYISGSVATDGAGIYVDGDNFLLKNSTVSSNTAEHAGGGIYIANHKDISIKDSSINSNKATNSGSLGGGIYNLAPDTVIDNCSLYGSRADNGASIFSADKITIHNDTIRSGVVTAPHGFGGGVCLYSESASNSLIDNCSFSSCYGDQGGAIALVNCNDITVNNCDIGNSIGVYYKNGGYNAADSDGAFIWMNGKNNVINDTTLHDGTAYGYGNIYIPSTSTNTLIDNCTFLRLVADGYHGGVIYSRADDLVVNNSYFEKNHCSINGGALYITGNNAIVENSEFVGNYAARGGAIYVGDITSKSGAVVQRAKDPVINNCNFTDNGVMPAALKKNVTKGGAIFSSAENSTVTNSNFTHNVGMSSGAIQYEYGPNFLENNTFTGNIAEQYGGGAVSSTKQGDTINNCNFTDNRANDYGGALSCDYPNITNSRFTNNHAYHGGAIFTIKANISDCEFEGNTADDNWVILALTDVEESNNIKAADQLSKSLYDSDYRDIDYDSSSEIASTEGYYVYCSEEFVDYPRYGVLWDDLRFVQNSLTEEYVGDYLKILIYNIWNDEADYKTIQEKINIFTDHDFKNSEDEDVKEALSLYDSGFRVSSENAIKTLDDGSLAIFNFKEIITPAATQNVIAFNVGYKPNVTVEKDLITKEPIVNNQQVEFNITVKNTGECNLTKIFVNDTDFSEGLVFDSADYGDYNWYYDNENKLWILNQTLETSETANIILKFNVTKVGNLTNNVSSGIADYTFSNDTKNITVYTPNMTVEKIANDDVVYVGNVTSFTVVVTNTGDCELSGVFVVDSDFSAGLEYADRFDSVKGTWNKEGDKWGLDGPLAAGDDASFTLYFNVIANGTLVNNVTAKSDLTNETNGTNSTKAFAPNMTVEKIANDDVVYVGNVTSFTVVVTNTGDCNLSGVFVTDSDYSDGLVYADKYQNGTGSWDYADGKWTLVGDLEVGKSADFTVYFNVVANGTLVNNVTAKSDLTNETNATNSTKAFAPNMTVEKIANNKTVYVGDLTSFTVVVTNTGDCDLTGVYISDKEYSKGLEYNSFNDPSGKWVYKGNARWEYDGALAPGESASLEIIFKATAPGEQVNTAIAGNNITNENVNSTNTTNVTEVPDNSTNTTHNDTNKTVPTDNETNHTVITVEKETVPRSVGSATGNPVLVLVLMLAVVVISPLRRKK